MDQTCKAISTICILIMSGSIVLAATAAAAAAAAAERLRFVWQ